MQSQGFNNLDGEGIRKRDARRKEKMLAEGQWAIVMVLFLRTKSVTKKEMNKCMAEIYDPGGIRTSATRLISQYHNHWAKENSP